MSKLSGVPVLVTGGAGFIGSHVVEELLRIGAKVRVLDNFSTGKAANLQHLARSVEVVRRDIRYPDEVCEAMVGAEAVFHLAAVVSVPNSIADPVETVDVNVLGTTNVFTAALRTRVKRVVYASSAAVYGDCTEIPAVEGVEGRVLSPYGLSKKMNEETAELFARSYGMSLVGLRYFNVVGQRQDPNGAYAAVVPKFCALAKEGKSLPIFGDGLQSRDFVSVRDVARANVLAAEATVEGSHVVNVGVGRGATVLELAKTILDLSGSAAGVEFKPARAGDIRESIASVKRAWELFSFEAKIPLEEELQRCLS
jgi:nucleoside-diphosphate-sugar epimerase